MKILDELEALERDATPGRLITGYAAPGSIPRLGMSAPDEVFALDGADPYGAAATFARAEDAAHYVALRRAAPALLRVARAAAAVADMWDARGSDELREMRTALAALEATP